MFFKSTLYEVSYAFSHPSQWLLLAWYDIKQRYRRSVLGPFWITISTAILITTLGFLWSTLFKVNIQEYLPYFAIGNILWAFISSQINESTTGFTQFENIIKQHRLPYPSYILRILSRNFIIMLHNAVIILIVISISIYGWTWKSLLIIPGLIILTLITYFISVISAILSTRYRDFVPIIQSFVTVAYFLSPIMWQQKTLPTEYQWIAIFNPITHLMDIVRAPLLGIYPTLTNWLVSLISLIIAAVFAYFLFDKSRSRISYWL